MRFVVTRMPLASLKNMRAAWHGMELVFFSLRISFVFVWVVFVFALD